MTGLYYQTNTRKTIDLGDGLVMRWSTKADIANRLDIRGPLPEDPLPEESNPDTNEFAVSSALRLLLGKSSSLSEFDFALVEDRTRGADKNPIVACVSLHRFEAYYGSVDLTFGRPQLIATDPNIDRLPPLAKDQTEPYTLRTANQADIPFLLALSNRGRLQTHAQIGLHYTREFWQCTVHDIHQKKQHRLAGDRETRIIVDRRTGADVGFAMTSQMFFGSSYVDALAIQEGVSYVDLVLPVFRQLAVVAKERSAREIRLLEDVKVAIQDDTPPTGSKPFTLSVSLHPRHPARVLLGSRVTPALPPGGFPLYTRIPSYPAFIRKVAPELERRLAQSPLCGISGLLRCNFFCGVEGSWVKGLEVVLDGGTIQAVRDWEKPSPQEAMKEKVQWKKKYHEEGMPCPQVWKAEFPPLIFSHLVMGRFGIEELLNMYGDVSVSDATSRLLLGTMFPKVDHHMDMTCW
ncbi:hypothetical protein BGZ81_011730 [Podila clonocystis]|nr:hypothetical protein BGZ81_011730 [Podila clonocystis]